ncbi:MAG: hypothetical protein RMJ00_00185 [Nitrososphaerota archaeon]|nr:hypothetical protein [Candidatus Bathyarchaeota archaeon]MCX8161812.1 hypothetical protein [Candidatus Bathyarchaeota archaeon]MDW8061112.1 hypothetical protein [Nitrososphaerota archaeon]
MGSRIVADDLYIYLRYTPSLRRTRFRRGCRVTVEVDDAGWGDPIGGCIIALRRVETGESYVGEIPLRFFQGDEFKRRRYLDEAYRIVLDGFRELKVSRSEEVKVCSGYVLSRVRARLIEDGYRVVSSKITGETQILAEEAYLMVLERYGVDPSRFTLTSGASRFHKLIEWVLEDPSTRVRYVKSGWKALREKWLKGYL